MSYLPTIGFCVASAVTNVNLTLEALGRGPNNISRKMCAIDPNATHETPATDYMMQDMSATDANVLLWNGLRQGVLPELDDFGNPVEWGEDGIISAEDALAAWSGLNVTLVSRSTFAEESDERPRAERPPKVTEWRDETIAGQALQFVPDEPL